MSFLNPLLLLAGLGVALPILAHLLNRYQVKRTDWAAMQFLNRSVRVRSRQLRLRDILLLLLRCLAVLLLALAMSRPSGDGVAGVTSRIGERRAAIVIAIDASYSMQHSDGNSTRFERAVGKAREIAEATAPGSPVTLVLLADEHHVVVRSMAFEADRFSTLLDALKPTAGALNMETVPSELLALASEQQSLQKEIYLITDLQARDWEQPAVWLLDGLKAMSGEARVYIVPVPGSPANLAVTDFELFSGLLRKGTMARYRATVRNYGPDPVSDVRVTCLLDEINVDSKVIPAIAGRSSQSVSFFVPFHNAGAVKLTAKVSNDALPLDDMRRSVASVRKAVSVLSVEGSSHGGSLESLVVKALRARGGGASKEEFKIQSVSWLSLPSQDLKAYDVIVLSDVPEITAGQAVQLLDYVKAGNGLIWFGGDNTKAAIWNKHSATPEGSLLPALIGSVASMVDEKGAGRPLDPILPAHPACRPLRSLPKDLLSEAQFYRVFATEPTQGSVAVLNLSGSSTPVLLEQSIGRGHVFMFTTTANPRWNNMALTPVFPMLLQQLVTYLTGREFETPELVGSSLLLSYPERPDANDGVFETPSGEIIRVPVREYAGQYVAILDQAREPGFYVARVSVQAPGQPVAVNVDTLESDVRCLTAKSVEASLDATGVSVVRSIGETIRAERTGYEFWRALMMGCLVVLVLESLLASRIFRRRV